MLIRTDNPVRDAERYFAEQDEKMEKCPKCCCCGQHIQEKFAVCNDGDWYCEECEHLLWYAVREEFLESTEETDAW